MNTQVVVQQPGAVSEYAMSAMEVRGRVNRIQQVMEAVMKENVHYGKIPGTPKPTLYKPGAEVLAVAFHIAPTYQTEDVSGPDMIRYRVKCIGIHQGTGAVLAEGVGECSSHEEKYKWRKAVSNAEFADTDSTRRRLKYGNGQNGPYTVEQVRTDPYDIANTVLKMACKRAQVAMTLNAVAASDIFAQDVEDLPEHLRDQGGTVETEKMDTSRESTVKSAKDRVAGRRNKDSAPMSIGLAREKMAEAETPADLASVMNSVQQADRVELMPDFSARMEELKSKAAEQAKQAEQSQAT